MEHKLARAAVLCVFALSAAVTLAPRTSSAQSLGDFAENGGAAAIANGTVMREAIASRKAAAAAAAARLHPRHQAGMDLLAKGGAPQSQPSGAPAGAAPGGPGEIEDLETPKPGFIHPDSPSLRYTVDLSSSYASGKFNYQANSLHGGLDIALFLAPTVDHRLFAAYYEESFNPIGFNQGIVPTYVQNTADGLAGQPGFPANGRSYCGAFGPSQANLIGILPNCNTDLANVQEGTNLHWRADATTRQRVMILSFQNVFWIAGIVPIVISPTWASSHADVAGDTDFYPAYDPSTSTYQFVHLRSNEVKQILLSLPLADSVKLFAVYTVGPQWNVNSNGLNQQNHAQIFQVLDLRYFANDSTTLFFQPGILQSEYPVDKYPQRTVNIITGFQHKLGGANSPVFIQGLVEEGGPTNPPYGHSGRIGAVEVTCVVDFPNCIQNPNPKQNIAVTYGGFKASTFQLQIGIGTPSVIPL